jgi:hypothetical protein
VFHLVTILFLEIVGLGFTMLGVRGGEWGVPRRIIKICQETLEGIILWAIKLGYNIMELPP